MTVFRFRGAHIALVFAALLVAPLSGPVGLALAPAVAAQSANERGRVSVGGSKIISDATRVDDTAIVAEAETGNPGRYRGRTSDASNAALASKPLQWQRRAKTRPEWQIGWREGLPQNAPTRRRSMKRTLGGIALMGLGVAVLIASPEECLNDKIEAKIQEYRDADGRRNPSVPGGCITKFRLNSKLFRVNGVIVTDRIDLSDVETSPKINIGTAVAGVATLGFGALLATVWSDVPVDVLVFPDSVRLQASFGL